MFNSDTFQLLILTTAAGYATYTLTNIPRTHIIEGNAGIDQNNSETNSETSNITSKISGIENEINVIIDTIDSYYTQDADTGDQSEINKFIAADNGYGDLKEELDDLNTQVTKIPVLLGNINDNISGDIENINKKLVQLTEIETVNHDILNNNTDSIKQQITNRKRLIRNNQYFAQRYQAMNDIIRYIIIIIVIMTFLLYLNARGFFSEGLSGIIIPTVSSLFIFFIFYQYMNIVRRNPLNFDEIQWDTSSEPKKNENFNNIV
tara:strand:+ start:10426 stop:11214 length:789 start_codon:yes stop_codon:yes gene_type:complete